jgi:hypothetical protein
VLSKFTEFHSNTVESEEGRPPTRAQHRSIPTHSNHPFLLLCIAVLTVCDTVQRPFINDLSKFPDTLWTKYYNQHPEGLLRRVEHGHPVAQDYSFGTQWITSVQHNLTYVVGPDSPVHQVSMEDAKNLYSAGPPYWFTARDGFLIAQHWAGTFEYSILKL